MELNVTDLAATRRFYETVLGWQFNDHGPAYAGLRAGRRGRGGWPRRHGRADRGGPHVLLCSHDLDATVAAAREA